MDWTTPFIWFFQIAMWALGIFLVLALVLFIILMVYALFKAFATAFKNVGTKNKSQSKPNLTPVE